MDKFTVLLSESELSTVADALWEAAVANQKLQNNNSAKMFVLHKEFEHRLMMIRSKKRTESWMLR